MAKVRIVDGTLREDARRFAIFPLDLHVEKILACGGLAPYLRRMLDGI